MRILALVLLTIATRAEAQTKIIYFGGYGASEAQMRCWEKGARAARPEASYSFRAIAYPAGAGAGRDSVVAAGQKVIACTVAVIQSHPADKFVIVGHSSGAALSNEVVTRVRSLPNVRLVDLDGFSPSASLQKSVKTTCLYAINPATGLRSLNAGSIKSACSTVKDFQTTRCSTGWCLHFSLVNKSAPATLGSSTFRAHGYDGCNTNLDWLPNVAASFADLDEEATLAPPPELE